MYILTELIHSMCQIVFYITESHDGCSLEVHVCMPGTYSHTHHAEKTEREEGKKKNAAVHWCTSTKHEVHIIQLLY